MLKIQRIHTSNVWTYHFSSVSFSIKDSGKIAGPEHIMKLGQDLWQWATQYVPKEFEPDTHEWVTNDGYELDQPTGTINWYVPSHIEPERIKPFIIEAIRQVLTPKDIEVGEIRFDKSNMFNANVFRIVITRNGTYDREKMPTFNAANTNAVALFEILDLPFSFSGSMNASDLKQRIAYARQHKQLEDYTRETIMDDNITAHGLPLERINYYLDQLEAICDRALAGDFPNPKVQWL